MGDTDKSGSSRRKRRLPVDRVLQGQAVARLHLQENYSISETAAILSISSRDAGDLLRQARRDGWVRVVVTPTYTTPPVLDPVAARNLEDRVGGGFRAVVVRVPERLAEAAPRASLTPVNGDDFLHRQLAIAACDHFLHELHNNDLVAIGAGRGPAFTVDAISELSEKCDIRVQLRGLTLLSITGGSIRRLSHGSSDPLDADIVTDGLSRALRGEPTDTRLVLLPIAMASEHEKLVAKVAPHLRSAWWKQHHVNVTLVGLGVLGPDHFTSDKGAHINEIARELEELRTKVISHPSGKGLIADVAHRLWLTRDPPPELAELSTELLKDINAKIVGVELESLDRSREKIVVAGGPAKYRALAALVLEQRSAFRPTTLVTDSDTAKGLAAEPQTA